MDEERVVQGQDNSKRRIFDWLSEPRPENITPFQRFTLDVDWSKSRLGKISQWPIQLKQMVLLVCQDSTPAVAYWGDPATIVYNEAYTPLIGRKHPALQGQDPRIGFAEVWDHFERLLQMQRETGQTVVEENAFLLFFRHGFYEETFFSWKFVPIIGVDGWVVGSHATVFEVTRQVISERRLETIRQVGAQLSLSENIHDLWSRLLLGLERADKDIPLALIYSVSDPFGAAAGLGSGSHQDEEGSSTSSIVCVLEGSIGIPKGHKLAPEQVDTHDPSGSWLARPFQDAMESLAQVVIDTSESQEMQVVMEGIEWRGYGTPSNTIVIIPIVPTSSKDVLGFLVMALNPRRPYDDEYRSFVHLLTEQVTSPQLSAVILREEVETRQMTARQEAIDRDRLHKELSDSETKLSRFATRAPFGLAILAPDGTALSANDLWRDLTQSQQIGPGGKVDWETILAPGHSEPVIISWARMIDTRTPVTMHTQVNRPWKAPELDSDGKDIWCKTNVLLTIYPDLDASGGVVSVMCCITDISSLKWSEEQLRKRMVQAIEMKQQQERFIDMTSHEMRNPLSALIGCADEIITSLRSLREHSRASTPKTQMSSPTTSHLDSPEVDDLLDEAITAADTIIYCALHQKRIIDDILTLSRLDSKLLLVSPEPAQPIQLIRNALKMFEAELKQATINLDLVERESLAELNVQWTLLDPSRVLQVFLNLMTNAIKFTRNEQVRNIKVTMGASRDKPSHANRFGIKYVQKNNNNLDQTTKVECGDREVVYIAITVEDTGRGLTEEEIKKLFHLFAQASPKTHQNYGGSGLGLFISRQLVEMQGGEIGVASNAGKGSTFEFYIKTRRTDPATEPKLSDLQLLMREETLREACGSEIPQLHHTFKKANRRGSSDGGVAGRPPERKVSISTTTLPIPIRAYNPPLPPHHRVLHIMVVEDNLVNQKVVAKSLRKAGHVVSVANHGEEALELIRHSEFWADNPPGTGDKLSVVLMDMEMPVMSGMECVRSVRELQREGRIRGHLPIIAVTANARKDQILEAIHAGMDDVTIKPYRMRDMLQQIEELLARHHNQSA